MGGARQIICISLALWEGLECGSHLRVFSPPPPPPLYPKWEELFHSKPDEKLEDPGDMAALQRARQEIGDYKLKTAGDYVVPESQRVSTERKRVQLVLLRKKV